MQSYKKKFLYIYININVKIYKIKGDVKNKYREKEVNDR